MSRSNRHWFFDVVQRRGRKWKSAANGSTKRRRKFAIEALELRSMLAGDVAGTILDDLNNNGLKDPGENGIAGVAVFADSNRNGNLDAGEVSGVTNQDGDYLLRNVAAGLQSIREILPLGYVPSTGTSAAQDITVKNSTEVLANFFNFRAHVGAITGTVWQDLNGDGVRAVDSSTGAFTDPGLSNWTVFLDANNNRILDSGEQSTLTSADGGYRFDNLSPGDYEVTEVLPAGWDVSRTFDSRQTATVVDGGTTTGKDFANVNNTNGGIQGTVWNDLNGDGVRAVDPVSGLYTDPGLAGWTVFLDTNNNRAVDAGETTTATDANGNYSFGGLLVGDYEVTEVLPAGWNVSPTFDTRQTVAVGGGAVTTARDFANFSNSNGAIQGVVWNDLNADGVRAVDAATGLFTDPGLVGWSVYLDLNGNGVHDAGEPETLTDVDGGYSFGGLQIGDYDVVEVLPSGWETAPTYGDNYTVAVFGGTTSTAHDFANHPISLVVPGSVSGTVWNDQNGNGVRDVDGSTGAYIDPGLAGWVVFVDQNGNGAFDSGELNATSATDGSYSIAGVTPGTVAIVEVAPSTWHATSPTTGSRSVVVKNGADSAGQDFGNAELKEASIRGTVYADANKNGVRDAGEKGLSGIVVYLDVNGDGALDAGDVQTTTSADQFFTPTVDEAGTYRFTHLAVGNYTVREVLPATLSSTPTAQLSHAVSIAAAQDVAGVDTAAVYRPNEIHGVRYNDANGNYKQDVGEAGLGGTTVYVDLNRNDQLDAGELTAVTAADGSYSFVGLTPGAYVVRDVPAPTETRSSQQTGPILWPAGTSNAAVGNVTPTSITTSLIAGQSYHQTVSLTLPNSGALTNLVDVFLLFDDTGSFTNNSPIVRAAFPDIIAQLQTSLPGIDLGFGVGRFEEYANYAWEYDSGRPFVLNQPIVAASTSGYMSAIQAALDRTTPGYGGDQPETDIEALYQLVTGLGFDGNNNGSVLDSGVAGLASTQLNPGASGDVPSFASFQADLTNGVMSAAGNVGGAGFRAGALPIVLLATDTGFAFQPKGETSITGVGGLTLPVGLLSETSRPDTPYNSGAGLQETVTALNALGALVIGLGTNVESTLDPRQGLEALSKLTGAVNRSTASIDNGTGTPIAPGDPLYFQIATGFGASVAGGVVNAIQNAVTNVAMNLTVQASDPRVKIINHTGTRNNVGAGQTASFDIEFIGDGIPHRFDLQFVRAGTNVVMGSIPVVLGTPIPGEGYDFCDLEDGEIETEINFGATIAATPTANVAPSFVVGVDQTVAEDSGSQVATAWATAISAGPASESGQHVNFIVTVDNAALFAVAPSISADGTLAFTPAANAFGTATISVALHDDGGTANGGIDTSAVQIFNITVTPVNDAPVAGDDSYVTAEDTALNVVLPGLLGNDADVEGDPLSASLVSGPNHGTLSLNADGTFGYTPDANYFGADSFTYRVNDGTANSNTATVSITVTPVNDAPVATNDAYTTAEDTALNVVLPGLLGNDADVEGDPLTAALVAGPNHGTLSLNADGTFGYTPDANYFGADSFTYRVNDGSANSNTATVSITVTPVNDAPVATNDAYTTKQGTALNVAVPGVLSNDSDIEGNVLTVAVVAGPSNGTLSLAANGSFVYTPNAGFSGSDSFTYRANDGAANSNAAVVSIQVTPVAVGRTNFYIADLKGTFSYDANGASTGSKSLNKENTKPQGVATNADGSRLWNIDDKGDVFVYDSAGKLLGTWTAKGVGNPDGIATDGTNLWIVDSDADRVFYYAGAAARLSGKAAATSSFALNAGNRNPTDIATDGAHLWVVNDTAKVDSIFRYTISGAYEGGWQLDPADKTPTGLALDPTDPNNLWVVDAGTDRVYQYVGGANRLSGSQTAASSFALNSGDRDPQGLATWAKPTTTTAPAVAGTGLTSAQFLSAIACLELSSPTASTSTTVARRASYDALTRLGAEEFELRTP